MALWPPRVFCFAPTTKTGILFRTRPKGERKTKVHKDLFLNTR